MTSRRVRHQPVRGQLESLEARALLTGNSFTTLLDYVNAHQAPSSLGPASPTALVASAAVATELNVKDFGAFGDGGTHPITQTELAKRGWTNKYQIGDEWDTIAWQEATKAARPGMIVVVPAGTYLVSGQLPLKSDVTWQGSGSVWKSRGSAAVVLDYHSELHNVSISDFTFQNLVVQFRSPDAGSIDNLQIRNCTFNGAKNLADPDAVQLYLIRASNVLIDGCTFSRDKTDVGRGLTIYKSQEVNVFNSKWKGSYITAIVVTGSSYDPATGTFPDESRCVGVRIVGNTIIRTVGTYLEDHGIYASGMRDITIANNTISGWSSAATGGAVKIRNGEDILIRNNRFIRSGILAYTYQEDGSMPQYFKNAIIERNTIQFEADGRSETDHWGILYWRNFGSPNDGREQNVVIRNNTVTGGVVQLKNSFLSAFSIFGNTASSYLVDETRMS